MAPQINVLPHDEICLAGTNIEAEPGKSFCRNLLGNDPDFEEASELSGAQKTCDVIVRQGFCSLDLSDEDKGGLLGQAWGPTPPSRLSCRAIVRRRR